MKEKVISVLDRLLLPYTFSDEVFESNKIARSDVSVLWKSHSHLLLLYITWGKEASHQDINCRMFTVVHTFDWSYAIVMQRKVLYRKQWTWLWSFLCLNFLKAFSHVCLQDKRLQLIRWQNCTVRNRFDKIWRACNESIAVQILKYLKHSLTLMETRLTQWRDSNTERKEE